MHALCRRYGVRRLELFGSAATGAFDHQSSDLDFIVEFESSARSSLDDYFGLKEALEALYERPVDLVMAGAMRNPYFVKSVNETRRVVYASENAQAA